MINTEFSSPLFFNSLTYLAYIGPGMSGGVIAAIFGIIAAFFLGLWGILYYPIKRYLKAIKHKKNILAKKDINKRK